MTHTDYNKNILNIKDKNIIFYNSPVSVPKETPTSFVPTLPFGTYNLPIADWDSRSLDGWGAHDYIS